MTRTVHPDQAAVSALARWAAPGRSDPAPVVSIYLPIDPLRWDGDLATRLRSSAQWARDALCTNQHMDGAAAEDLLAPFMKAAESTATLAEAGLSPDPSSRAGAWFVTAGQITCLSLPMAAGPFVGVGDGPDLLRLLPSVSAGTPFFVVAVSQRQARLFRADRYRIEPIAVPGLPHGVDDALWYVKREPDFNRHGSGAMHAAGGGQDFRKDDTRQYLHMVDKAIAPIVSATSAPLVVAGIGYEAAMFINETHYRHVAPTAVVGNADTLDLAAIHERACEIVQALPKSATTVAARVCELVGTGKALVDAAEIRAAAVAGAVADVVVARSVTESAETHDNAPAGVAAAVNAALATGATVHVVDDAELPVGTPIAALLRY